MREALFSYWRGLNFVATTTKICLLNRSGRKEEGFLSWNSKVITHEDSYNVRFCHLREKDFP